MCSSDLGSEDIGYLLNGQVIPAYILRGDTGVGRKQGKIVPGAVGPDGALVRARYRVISSVETPVEPDDTYDSEEESGDDEAWYSAAESAEVQTAKKKYHDAREAVRVAVEKDDPDLRTVRARRNEARAEYKKLLRAAAGAPGLDDAGDGDAEKAPGYNRYHALAAGSALLPFITHFRMVTRSLKHEDLITFDPELEEDEVEVFLSDYRKYLFTPRGIGRLFNEIGRSALFKNGRTQGLATLGSALSLFYSLVKIRNGGEA